MNYSNGGHYEVVKSYVNNTWSQTGNFVIMNETSANIVRFGVYTYVLK